MKNSTKKPTLKVSMLITAMGLVLLSACGGGGGGGGSGSGDEVISSTLDTASVETLASKAVLEGDCVGVSGIADLSARSSTLTESDSDTLADQSTLASRESDYTDLISGLVSGTFSKTGDHDSGTDTLTYQYTNYGNPVGNLLLTANGSASVVYHGVPGDFGPVVSNKTVSTNGPVSISKIPNISLRSGVALKTTASYELSVTGLNQIYASLLTNPDDLVVESASVKNMDTGKVYKISNLKSKGSISSSQVILSDLSYTFTGSDIGTVAVTSDSVIINLDGRKIPSSIQGTLGMTATDGTKAETVIQSNGTIKIFTVNDSGTTLTSEIDCAGLVH